MLVLEKASTYDTFEAFFLFVYSDFSSVESNINHMAVYTIGYLYHLLLFSQPVLITYHIYKYLSTKPHRIKRLVLHHRLKSLRNVRHVQHPEFFYALDGFCIYALVYQVCLPFR